jgi:putative membrane protein
MSDTKTEPTSATPVTNHVAKQAEAVMKSASAMEASAGAVEQSALELTESADRRTVLAADRTLLAAERTYAAWLRTGLVATASGIGARALTEQHVPSWLAVVAGAIMLCFSVFCYSAAGWRQLRGVRDPSPSDKAVSTFVLIAFCGLMSAVSLAALITVIWLPGLAP